MEDDSGIPACDLLSSNSSSVTPSHCIDSIKLPPIDKKWIHQDNVSDNVEEITGQAFAEAVKPSKKAHLDTIPPISVVILQHTPLKLLVIIWAE